MFKLNNNKDTVEEFWDANTLAFCREEARRTQAVDFLDELRLFLDTPGQMWAARSGRFALQQFLIDVVPNERDSVLVASFNCKAVAEAVIRAGFQIETFDLADSTGRIEWANVAAQLKPQHGALVVPHLFGVPTDFRPLQARAERLGIVIIEDCAMTLGGKISTFTAGTLGNAAIFSFNYDKPISLGGGGALLVNKPDLASRISLDQAPISLEREELEIHLFIEYLHRRRQNFYMLRLSPANIARRMFRRIKHLVRPPPTGQLFPVSGIGPLRAALGLWQLKHYREVMTRRNEHAALFSTETGCQSWHIGVDIRPAWIKQKVIPFETTRTGQISKSLQRQGLRVGPFNWPKTIDQHLGLPEKPQASFTAKYGLDIPIHQNMTPDELEYIRETVCGERNK